MVLADVTDSQFWVGAESGEWVLAGMKQEGRERGGVPEGLADPGGPRLSFLCLG